jgi:hypothetical protein
MDAEGAVDIERTMEFILERAAATEALLQEIAEQQKESEKRHDRHDREMAEIRATLRRAIRLSVEEQRRERVRRQELEARFDDKITQLASAHLLAEEEIRRLQDLVEKWYRRNGGNGNQTS